MDAAGVITNAASVSINGRDPEEVTGGPVLVVDPIEGLEKKVYDGETGGYEDALEVAAGRGEVLEYRIAFRLPEDMTSYGSITIEDIMPAGLEYVDGSLNVTTGGVDVTTQGAVTTGTSAGGGFVVSFELGGGEGYFAGLAGAVVEMYLRAIVSNSFGIGTLVNMGRVLVNGDTPAIVTGPPIMVTDQTPGAIRDLKKEIYSDIKGTYVDFINITDHEATLDYLISFKMPEDAKGYKIIEMQDLLPESLTLAGLLADSVTITVDGAVVDGGQLVVKYPDSGGGVISYTFDRSVVSDLAGAEIAMRVLAKIVPGTANGSIANKGRVLINDDPSDPTLPDDKPEEPSEQTDGPEVNIVDQIEDLAKLVWDGEKYVNELTVNDRTQVLEYQIGFRLPTDIGGYKSVEIQDLLPAALELAGTLEESVKVYVDGVITAGLLTVKYGNIGGGTISYSFDEALISSLAGAEVAMKIRTKIKGNAEYGDTIRNIGRVLINEDPRDPTEPGDEPTAPSEETEGPDVTPYPSYTVTFDGNGGSVSGQDYRMAYYPDYHVSSLPNVSRPGRNFLGWNFAANGSGRSFTLSTTVDANITVYAQWSSGSGDGQPEPPYTPPAVIIVPDDEEKTTGSSIVPEGPPVIIPDEAPPTAPAPPRPTPPRPGAPVVIGDSEVPMVDIPVAEPPLITITEPPVPPAEPPVWALLNLLLAALGGLIAIMLLATAIRRRDEDSYGSGEELRKDRRQRNIWRTLGVLSGLVGIITFVLTENIHNIMVLTDRWTPLMIVIEVAVLVFTYLVYRRENRKDPDDGTDFEPANLG
jgi:fimbrial isopeptide formation D2 family protein